jgi:hypothetical protein
MNVMISSLHLRLANVRRFLDKHLPDGGDFNNDAMYQRLLKMVREWNLPVCIRVDSQNEYEAVLVEKILFNDVNLYDKENTKDFYVLGCGFKTEQECKKWLEKACLCFVPWTLGRFEEYCTKLV